MDDALRQLIHLNRINPFTLSHPRKNTHNSALLESMQF